MINAIRDKIERDGMDFLFRFFLVYLGNPIIFILFVLLALPGAIKIVSNVMWLNPIYYILVTLPIYAGWIFIITLPPQVDTKKIFEAYVSNVAICVAIPGLINIFVWCSSGMESNIMGFIFFGPLVIAAIVNMVLWICAMYSSLRTANSTQYGNMASVDGVV